MDKEKRMRRMRSLLLFGPYIAVLIPVCLCVIMIFINLTQAKEARAARDEVDFAKENQEALLEEIATLHERNALLDEKVDKMESTITKLEARLISNKTSGDEKKVIFPKKVYLTFDDGPSANTEKILDILADYKVKGNFFVVGTKSSELRKMYKRIVEEGHVIGMHSYSHKYSEVYASKDAFVKDLDKIQELIFQETGVKPTIYRFPGGSSNTVSRVPMSELMSILDERGITFYDWNVLSGDAVNPALPVEDIVINSLSTVGEYEEAMILFHDLSNKTTTVEALPQIIEALLEQGIEIAAIDDTTMLIQHNTN